MLIRKRRHKISNLILAVAIICNFLSSFSAAPTYAESCKDVEFIFARGSGENLNDKSYHAWQTAITTQLSNTSLTFNFYELGSDLNAPYQYPATAVSGGFWDYVNLVSAYFSGGKAFAFGTSVEQGMLELEYRVATTSRACPRTKFVLGGYSQGAMVMTQTLSKLNSEKLVFVTNFGDPKLYLPEGNNTNGFFPKVPEACRGKKLSDYRTYVPDCYAFEGILGSQRPYRTDELIGKVGTWCNKSDIMCSSGMNIDDHSAYISENLYLDAASKIYQKLAQTFSDKFPSQSSPNLHDVLFLLDATGSMRDLMKLYRTELKNLAKQVYDSGGRAGLWGYRDSSTQRSSWAMCELGCSETDFFNRIGYYSASGGGDAKESLLSALHYAMKESKWRWGATKSIVVLTDDGYKEPDFEDVDLPQIISESLAIDPVNVYVIAPNDLKDDYSALTTQTGGQFFGLDPKLDDSVLAENLSILASSSEQIFRRPVARLQLPNYHGGTNQEFLFDASGSYSLNGHELQYDWDLDGDGKFELKNRGAKITQTYAAPFDNFIQVRVRDGELFSTMSARVQAVSEELTPAEPLTTITNLNYSLREDNSTRVAFATDASYVLVSLDSAILGFTSINQGRGEFVIGDLTKDLTITLIPYSASKQRGMSQSLHISLPLKQPPLVGNDSPDLSPSPISPPASSQPVVKPSYNYSPIRPTPPDEARQTAPVIPAAPNAGAFSQRLALAMGT